MLQETIFQYLSGCQGCWRHCNFSNWSEPFSNVPVCCPQRQSILCSSVHNWWFYCEDLYSVWPGRSVGCCTHQTKWQSRATGPITRWLMPDRSLDAAGDMSRIGRSWHSTSAEGGSENDCAYLRQLSKLTAFESFDLQRIILYVEYPIQVRINEHMQCVPKRIKHW